MTLNLALYSPELILCFTLIFALIIHMVSKHRTLTFITVLIGLTVSGIDVVSLYHYEPQLYFSSHLSHDSFSLFFKILFIGVTTLTILFGFESHEITEEQLPEFYTLLLSVTIGLCTLVSSTHLLTLYLSLELVSITSYVLAGFKKENLLSNEASIKYLIYGALASGTLLWGLSLLYGFTGSFQLSSIQATLTSSPLESLSGYLLFFMLLFGFGFKMTIAPFHMWAPDVYQGAPTPIVAFLTVAPKAAGFAFFIRVFFTLFAKPSDIPAHWVPITLFSWPTIMAILSAITMTIGNLSALFQQNTKRMLAYSSIAHAGYLLMGIVVLNQQGLAAILFYIFVYFFMNFGAFFIVGLVGDVFKDEKIKSFRGLGWKSPLVGIPMAIFLLSLTGIPPFAGFVGKVYLFSSLIKGGVYWLLIIAIINTVISFYYYAYIIKEMFLEKPDNKTPLSLTFLQGLSLSVLTLGTCVLGIYWEPAYQWILSSLP